MSRIILNGLMLKQSSYNTTKMLCGYFLILLTLGCVQSYTVQTANGIAFFTDRVAGIIKKKCSEYGNQAISNEALDGLHDFTEAWQIVAPERPLVGDEYYHYCMAQGENFTHHLSTFMEKLVPCLEPQEKYLKQFILDSYGNHNHYFCKALSATGNDKKNLDNCYKKLETNPEMNPAIECFNHSEVFGNIKTLGVIKKATFCSDISDIASCYEEILNENCADSPEVKELQLILLKQALENCLKDTSSLQL